jgi:DNA topoisomerase-6 subunit B
VTADLGPLVIFPRGVEELPPETKEIQPHPRGVELGTLLQMLKDYEANEKGGTLYNFLQEKFCRISPQTAGEFCKAIGCTSRTKASEVESQQAEKLYKEFQDSKLAPPPTDCLAPIGVQQLLRGMFKGVRAEFYAASSREAAVYRGRPFLIESAIAFGGELPSEDTARVIRFANRVPLLFQQSACSSFKAVTETNWRNYDLQQPRGGLPVGALVIMIHMASVWVPFTSESKEAIADYDEIRKEMKLALMECGRKLGTYLKKRAKMRREGERRDVFERYIGEISRAISAITEDDTKKLYDALLKQARERTAIADAQLTDEGKMVKDDPADQEGVLIIGGDDANTSVSASTEKPPAKAEDDDTRVKAAKAAKEVSGKARKNSKSDEEDIFKASKAESAALKVAALANDDDDEPRKKRGSPEASAKAGIKGNAKSEAKADAKAPAKTPVKNAAPEPPQKKAKPRVKLVNGKYVPVDEPGLF